MPSAHVTLRLITFDYLVIGIALTFLAVAGLLVARQLRSLASALAALGFGYSAIANFAHHALQFMSKEQVASLGFTAANGPSQIFLRLYPLVLLVSAATFAIVTLRMAKSRT